MDAAQPEVVRVGLHRQSIDPDSDRPLFLRITHVPGTIAVISCLLQYLIGYKVLTSTITVYNRLDQILRYILIVREKLLRILWKTVPAHAERWVIVVISDSRIEANTFNDFAG